MTFCGLGNVEGVFWADGGERRLTTDRGIVGTAIRTLHPISLPLGDEWLLVLHTDGVKSRFRVSDLVGAGTSDPALMAQVVLERFGRDTDDATVLVANAASTRTD
jgi:hypothetical protein